MPWYIGPVASIPSSGVPGTTASVTAYPGSLLSWDSGQSKWSGSLGTGFANFAAIQAVPTAFLAYGVTAGTVGGGAYVFGAGGWRPALPEYPESLWTGWANLGDSIAAQSASHSRGAVLSLGKKWINSFGYAGKSSYEILSHVSDVVASGADRCIVMVGTNDAQQGTGVNALYSNAVSICNNLRDNGVIPVLCFIPPNNTHPERTYPYNMALERAAKDSFTQIVRCWDGAADPGTGAYLSGWDIDGTHPNPVTNGIASGLLASALVSRKSDKLISTSNVGGIVTGGCFVVDTNTDGIADGWASQGTGGTFTLSASTNGKKQNITCNLASSSDKPALSQSLSGIVVGNKYQISGKIRISSSVNNLRGSVFIRFKNSGGSGIMDLYACQLQEVSGIDLEVFAEGVAPPLTASAQVYLACEGLGLAWPCTGIVSFERIQALDLTANGLA